MERGALWPSQSAPITSRPVDRAGPLSYVPISTAAQRDVDCLQSIHMCWSFPNCRAMILESRSAEHGPDQPDMSEMRSLVEAHQSRQRPGRLPKMQFAYWRDDDDRTSRSANGHVAFGGSCAARPGNRPAAWVLSTINGRDLRCGRPWPPAGLRRSNDGATGSSTATNAPAASRFDGALDLVRASAVGADGFVLGCLFVWMMVRTVIGPLGGIILPVLESSST